MLETRENFYYLVDKIVNKFQRLEKKYFSIME